MINNVKMKMKTNDNNNDFNNDFFSKVFLNFDQLENINNISNRKHKKLFKLRRTARTTQSYKKSLKIIRNLKFSNISVAESIFENSGLINFSNGETIDNIADNLVSFHPIIAEHIINNPKTRIDTLEKITLRLLKISLIIFNENNEWNKMSVKKYYLPLLFKMFADDNISVDVKELLNSFFFTDEVVPYYEDAVVTNEKIANIANGLNQHIPFNLLVDVVDPDFTKNHKKEYSSLRDRWSKDRLKDKSKQNNINSNSLNSLFEDFLDKGFFGYVDSLLIDDINDINIYSDNSDVDSENNDNNDINNNEINDNN